MTTIITRLYDTEDKAKAAAAAARARIGDDAVDVFTGASGGKRSTALRNAISKAGASADAAEEFAGAMKEGTAMVLARAPWGRAQGTKDALDSAGPMATDATPELYVSDNLGSRDLSIIPGNRKFLTADKDAALVEDRTPFSSFFGWRVLSDRRPKDNLKRGDPHIMPGKTLSEWKLGAPLITQHTAVFSKWLGWETLKEKPETHSLLEKDRTPFSSALGWKTLTD
ncbi:MAG: hypothetical protein AAF371_00860 [Pseudomonadota bacterium]